MKKGRTTAFAIEMKRFIQRRLSFRSTKPIWTRIVVAKEYVYMLKYNHCERYCPRICSVSYEVNRRPFQGAIPSECSATSYSFSILTNFLTTSVVPFRRRYDQTFAFMPAWSLLLPSSYAVLPSAALRTSRRCGNALV